MCLDFMPNRAADGSSISARTLEFGFDTPAEGIIRKPGGAFCSPVPEAESGGLSWTNTYGYIGSCPQDIATLATTFSVPYLKTLNNPYFLLDGMNEAGLSCGGLWLPQTQYPHMLPQEDSGKALYYLYFTDWVLGTCATVEDVKSAFNRGEICLWADGVTDSNMPLHFIVYDKNGNGIVIEHVNGICHVHDNPYLVCTNAPTFDWQKTNVMNYVGLSNDQPADLAINTGFNSDSDAMSGRYTASSVGTTGHGAGLRGIPGDYTPPSRLIRTLILKNYAAQATDADDLCTQALHILNNTDITLGTSHGDTSDDSDYTQFAVIRDFSRKRYYFRTYDNMQLRMVDLGKALKLAGPEMLTFKISGYPDLAEEVSPAAQTTAYAHAAQ